MVLPDYFFIKILNVFEYTDTSSLHIGIFPIYIIFIWVIPLFIIIYAAELISEKYKKIWIRNLFLIIASTYMFTYIEGTTWEFPAWYYHNVKQYANLAAYTILSNIFLGIIVYYGYKFCENKSLFYKILTAFVTVLINSGVLLFSYFIIEKTGIFF